MNPGPLSLALVASMVLAAGCYSVEDVGLTTVDPSSQPVGGEGFPDADTPPPGTLPDASAEADAPGAVQGTSIDDAGASADAGPASGEDAAEPSPDLPPPPPDAAPAPPPDSAPTVEPADPAGTCPQTPDLALCLRFEGAVRDDSRYQLTADTRNVEFQAGPAGQAVALDAQSSIVVPPNPIFDTAAVTLEAWVHPRALGRRMGVVYNGNQYALVILPSGSAMCTGGGGYALTGNAVKPGQWTSLACTYDADRVTLWIDGSQTAESPRTGPLRTGSPTGVGVGYEAPEGNVFDGLIDNVRVWRRVRTASQLCAGARGCSAP
jgi:hypothetical protein